MFTGYFDASGSEQTVAFVVGGYVAKDSVWERFSAAWGELLLAHGVDCFHMREFAHSTGRFKAWKDQEQRRDEFIQSAIRSINKHGVTSFACGVLVEDYQVVDREFPLHEIFGNPYALCGESCLAFIEEWIENNPERRWPEMIFDRGDQHKGELMSVFEFWGLDPPVFRDKTEAAPLQAADLVAWENLKVYRTVGQGRTDLRKSLLQLRKRPHHWKTLDMKALLGLTEDEGIPPRSRMPRNFVEMFRTERQSVIRTNRKKRAVNTSHQVPRGAC